MKLWGGRFSKETDKLVEEFSSSIHIDGQMARTDIVVSIAHAKMLGLTKIITLAESQSLVEGLQQIDRELTDGTWSFSENAEDIHGEIECRLIELKGEVAKKLHTARSRNDQVATDTRYFLSNQSNLLIKTLRTLQREIVNHAKKNTESILPGLTHFQHAQPVSLAHHLLCYFWMLQRDIERLSEAQKRTLTLPLGSAALAGTSFPIDRAWVAKELGFLSISPNSMDSVSDRDFVIEFLSHASLMMMHLSRLSEELILWSAPEFSFVELGDEVTTGSSIMPQKKNPDVLELIRGRVGRVYGNLMGSLTMMKGLPLAYNRDMQEDKEHLFSGLQVAISCARLMTLVLQKARWNTDRMRQSLKGDFSNATDLADDLAKKGLPFRDAHELVGKIVQDCIAQKKGLEELSLKELQNYHRSFDETSVQQLQFSSVLRARKSPGGTAPNAVLQQIIQAEALLSTP